MRKMEHVQEVKLDEFKNTIAASGFEVEVGG